MKPTGTNYPLLTKRIRFIRLVSIFLAIVFYTSGNAQTAADTADIISNVQTLSLVSKHYGDSIVLRWAPVNAEYWYKQFHQPCLVSRREVYPNPGK